MKVLGEGGFSFVYLAQDVDSGVSGLRAWSSGSEVWHSETEVALVSYSLS